MRAPISGGSGVPLAMGQNNPQGITVDALNVYWTESTSAGTVQKVPLLGGTPVKLASGLSYPVAVVVDGANAYWTNKGTGSNGSVMKTQR